MDHSRLVRLNQPLLTGTALLAVGSIVAGAVGGPVLAGIANFTAGMTANNLGALVERLRNSSDVLRNKDLAKAAGRAVGLTLGKISPKFPEIEKELNKLAQKTEAYWLQWAEQAKTLNLFESLQEDQLVKIFSNQPDQFTQYQVLPLTEWQEVVTWLFAKGSEDQVLKGISVNDYQDVIAALAAELARNFNKNLREVLKDDAAKGGEAFAGMLFDLHGATLAQIAEIQQYLPQIATREDICRLLQQLDTGIRDELGEIRKTLQQYLDLNKPRLPIPQNCETIITEKIQDFVGRRYVFEAIREFLQGKPKGYFILEADPGVGKSAILAKLVDISQRHCLTHFNSQGSGIVTAGQFLESICTQLIQGYLKDKYPSLPANTNQDGNVFAQLLGEASKTLPRGQKLVIVVDALDEVDLSKQNQGSNVLYLPDALPDNVYFILSKRPKLLPFVVSAPQQEFNMMSPEYDQANLADIQGFIGDRCQQEPIQRWLTAQGVTEVQFTEVLARNSENNFMYLKYVLNDIEKWDIDKEKYGYFQLANLPKGLEKYYEQHWQRMGMVTNPLPRTKLKIIYLLSKTRKPVSCDLLADFAKEEPLTVQEVLDEWEQFLHHRSVDAEEVYSIYHKSFQDFLFNKKTVQKAGISLQDIERAIADNLWGSLYGEDEGNNY
jgi:hypothetical protein